MAWYRCGGTPSSVLSLPTPSEASGAIAQFNTDLTENLLSAVAEFSASQASGTPSPSAPIAINGVDKVEVVNFSVNIWNEDWETGGYDLETGQKVASTVRIRNKNLIPVKPNMELYIVVPITVRLFYYGKGREYLGYATGNGLRTVPNDTYYLAFQMGSTQNPYQSYNNDISFNYPNTYTTYQAFNGTTALINLGGTYYGGSVDAVAGKITLDHGFYNALGNNISNVVKDSNSWRIYYSSAIYGTDNQYKEGLCDKLGFKTSYSGVNGNNNSIGFPSSAGTQILIRNDALTSAQEVRDFMATIEVVYPLATPIVVYASNTAEIPTIVGDNQVFADTGDVAVEYFETVGHKI